MQETLEKPKEGKWGRHIIDSTRAGHGHEAPRPVQARGDLRYQEDTCGEVCFELTQEEELGSLRKGLPQRDPYMKSGLAGKGECSPEKSDPEGFEYLLGIPFQWLFRCQRREISGLVLAKPLVVSHISFEKVRQTLVPAFAGSFTTS